MSEKTCTGRRRRVTSTLCPALFIAMAAEGNTKSDISSAGDNLQRKGSKLFPDGHPLTPIAESLHSSREGVIRRANSMAKSTTALISNLSIFGCLSIDRVLRYLDEVKQRAERWTWHGCVWRALEMKVCRLLILTHAAHAARALHAKRGFIRWS